MPLTGRRGPSDTYALAMLQAETLAAALTYNRTARFADAASAPDPVRRAAEQLGSTSGSYRRRPDAHLLSVRRRRRATTSRSHRDQPKGHGRLIRDSASSGRESD